MQSVRSRPRPAAIVYAPVYALSDGAPGAIVIAPGDTRGTVLIPEKRGGACCGIDGAHGPNMACMSCGLPVASRSDDCSLWQAVWLTPDAVCRLPIEGTEDVPLSWAELMDNGKATPPFEPMTMVWGSRLGLNNFWSWSPQWEAAAGQALAHLLAASQGRPVTVPNGLTTEVFQRSLDALLPVGLPERRAVRPDQGCPSPTRTPTSFSCRSIRRPGRSGPCQTQLLRHTGCHCRSACGCG
jgi:hypothetical protein